MQKQALMQAYLSLIESGAIQRDERQLALLDDFADLAQQLEQKPSFWQKLTGKAEPIMAGIYLWGDVGRGKSMLMDLFFDALPENLSRTRIHFHAFMSEIHLQLHDYRMNHPEVVDPLPAIAADWSARYRLVCLDEFQVHDIADAMILSRLFQAMIEKGVVTVTTSNRPPKDLYMHGLQRESFLPFIAMVEKRFRVLCLNHETDYRLQKLQGHEVYFTALERVTEMEEVFASLIQHDPKPAEIHVKGRTIYFAKASDGCLWTSFTTLCEQPLGAEDYNTLASEFHTIFLTDIPKMTREQRNEAKRFVLLIDALYEHKTRFICCAEVSAEKLYPQGDGSFEFQRTISRLMEMQSEAYLGAVHSI